jgi:hypothetical protein
MNKLPKMTTAEKKRAFTPGEPVWLSAPDGPKYGQPVWDLKPMIYRKSQAERYIDFTMIPEAYRSDTMNVLMVVAQPDRPEVIQAGIVRRGAPANSNSAYGTYTSLRAIARWGISQHLRNFSEWCQTDCDNFLNELRTGEHRENGHPLGDRAISLYVSALKLLWECKAFLEYGLSFRPWEARNVAEISTNRIRRPSNENKTAPLVWEQWAPLVAASWKIADEWSLDIIAAQQAWHRLPSRPLGPGGKNAFRIIEQWDAGGGVVPLHTGFGRSPGKRGEINITLFCRIMGINDSVLKKANKYNYRPEAIKMLQAAAADPERGRFGGITSPTVHVTHQKGFQSTWIDELGLGETEYLVSVLRAACYVIVSCLTGMRDSEIQELTKHSVTTYEGLPALKSIEHKGNDILEGQHRYWWAPQPVIRSCHILAELTPHTEYLFARDERNAGAYSSDRDIPRLISFVNGDPSTRPGRGLGLEVEPIETRNSSRINATTLRRSFAIYSTTKPGAELGLGIQLGHAAWRMTSGYFSDGQQQAVQHLDKTRKNILRDQAQELIGDSAPVAGPAAKRIDAFRAQIVANPSRAERIYETVADRIHLGLTNDCLWNPNSSGCGNDGPHLADHICIGLDCSNALATQEHARVIAEGISRIDNYLEAGNQNPKLAEQLGASRRKLAQTLRQLRKSSGGIEG